MRDHTLVLGVVPLSLVFRTHPAARVAVPAVETLLAVLDNPRGGHGVIHHKILQIVENWDSKGPRHMSEVHDEIGRTGVHAPLLRIPLKRATVCQRKVVLLGNGREQKRRIVIKERGYVKLSLLLLPLQYSLIVPTPYANGEEKQLQQVQSIVVR